MRYLRHFLLVFLVSLSAPHAGAIVLTPVVATGLSSPIFVGHAGDGSNRLFIVEQGGVIKVVQPGASTATVFLDIHSKVVAGGERGLLGLAFHPRYPVNGRFFVYYTRTGDGALNISEYQVSADANVADASETVLLTIPHPTNANHNGGMLAFGPDGYLYMGVGDGGSAFDPPNNAQNSDLLLGKILRIDVNRADTLAGTLYSAPPDNPYIGVAGRDEIFAIGLRNPWRFSFDRVTRQQWVGDVGQGSREEVDTPLVKGGNYGWSVYEGSLCTNIYPLLCNPANYLFPVLEYGHTGGRCAITGGYVYRGWRGTLPAGTYVYGDYCSGEIFSWNGATQSLLLDTTMNISSFGEDEQGEMYVVDLLGSVSRIVSSTPNSAPALQTATSRKAHGSTTFDLPLSLIAFNPTIEPRTSLTATIVMTFDKPVVAADVSITEGVAITGPPSFNGNEVVISLNGMRDAQYVTIAINNVVAADGGFGGSGSVRIGFLAGDVDASRSVSLTDMLLVNAVLTQNVTSANYRRDVNASGTLTLSDLLSINANLTRTLPPP